MLATPPLASFSAESPEERVAVYADPLWAGVDAACFLVADAACLFWAVGEVDGFGESVTLERGTLVASVLAVRF